MGILGRIKKALPKRSKYDVTKDPAWKKAVGAQRKHIKSGGSKKQGGTVFANAFNKAKKRKKK
jgi:hypothetical protein